MVERFREESKNFTQQDEDFKRQEKGFREKKSYISWYRRKGNGFKSGILITEKS
jgi:hypothetical protein